MPRRPAKPERRPCRTAPPWLTWAALAWAIVHGGGPALAEAERPLAGGGLAWVLNGDLVLLGDLWALVPIHPGKRGTAYAALEARTTIAQAQGLTFLVRELEYDVDVGWRGAPRWLRDRTASLFVGWRGNSLVDAVGDPYVRYLGVGLESAGFRSLDDRGRLWDWALAGGPVLHDHRIEAAAAIRGAARFRLRAPGGRRPSVGFDVTFDGLRAGGRLRGDIEAGPRVSLAVPGGRRASLHLHRQIGRHPLGFGEDVWILGFAYEEGRGSRADGVPPEIDGSFAVGGGDGRLAGQLRLRFLSPRFAGSYRGVFDVDANVLSASGIDELYYLFHAGLELGRGDKVAGAYFYHRSNHQLSAANDRVTSLNVLEVGVETAGWSRPGKRGANLFWGVVDARARVGYLIDGTFGESRRWHVRGGLRAGLPIGRGRPAPFVRFEGEAGEIERRTIALGVWLTGDWELELEHRRDDQYFGTDDTAMLLTGRRGF